MRCHKQGTHASAALALDPRRQDEKARLSEAGISPSRFKRIASREGRRQNSVIGLAMTSICACSSWMWSCQ